MPRVVSFWKGAFYLRGFATLMISSSCAVVPPESATATDMQERVPAIRTTRLLLTDWSSAARDFCCHDAMNTFWREDSFEVRHFVFSQQSDSITVDEWVGAPPFPLPLYEALLRNQEESLPPGRRSSAMVGKSIVVGVDRGGHGGDLIVVSELGHLEYLWAGDVGVRDVAATEQGDAFAVVRRKHRGRDEVACFERKDHWVEVDAHEVASAAALGKDEIGTWIGVDSLGRSSAWIAFEESKKSREYPSGQSLIGWPHRGRSAFFPQAIRPR